MCCTDREMVECFQTLSEDSSCRVVLLTGAGKSFTAGQTERILQPYMPAGSPPPLSGLDLVDFAPMFSQFQSTTPDDVARRTYLVRRLIEPMQASFTAIEKVEQFYCPFTLITS